MATAPIKKLMRLFLRARWLLLWLLVLAPKLTWAAETSTPAIGGSGGIVQGIYSRAVNIGVIPFLPIVYAATIAAAFVAWIIIAIEGMLLGWILDPNNFPIAGLAAVETGWGIVRDIANLFFILALVWIALATMLRLESYGMRQTLWRLIAAALLVNFSFIIAAGILDFADALTRQFLQPVGGGQGAIQSFMGATGIVNVVIPPPTSGFWSLLKSVTSDLVSGTPSNLWFIFNSITGAVFLLILMFILLAALIFLIIRVIYLWILLIFAPMAWVAWIFPASKQLWTQWWSNFFRWAFFAPVFTFFLYLALLIVAHPDLGTKFLSLETMFSATELNKATSAPVFMKFIITSGLLIAGLMSANRFSITGAGMVMNMGKGLRGWGLGIASRWAARGAPLPKPIQQLISRAWKPGGAAWQRALTAPLKGLQWAGTRGAFSPEVWKRTVAQRKARAEAESYSQAVGSLDDALRAVLSLKPSEIPAYVRLQRIHYEQMGRQRAVQDRISEIKKVTTEEDQLVAMYRRSTEPIEREALFRILASINGINTLFKEEGRALDPTSLQDYIKDDFGPKIGDEFAALLAADVSHMAKENGNFSFAGMAKWDDGKKQMVFTSAAERQQRALGDMDKIEFQQLVRQLHPDSLFARDTAGNFSGLHDTGKAIVQQISGADTAQFGRAQKRTLRAIVQRWNDIYTENPTEGPQIVWTAHEFLRTGVRPTTPPPAGWHP